MLPYDHTNLHTQLNSLFASITNAAVIAFVADALTDYLGSTSSVVADYMINMG